jgi:UDP-glucuronate decarboxylase
MTVLDDDLKEIFCRVSSFWRLKNRNILITGSAGFLGYYYSNFLLRYSRELELASITLADIKNPRSRIEVEYDASIVNFLEMDMSCDKTDKSNKKKYDVIINLASFASPVAYRADPIATLRGSVLSVWNLLEDYTEDSEQNGSFQIFSSSEIYGDPPANEIPTSEDYRGNVSCLGPRACYDESKRFIETLGSVYAKQNGANISVIRPFNNFGP